MTKDCLKCGVATIDGLCGDPDCWITDGTRVTFAESVERYPFFTIPKGTTGTVTSMEYGVTIKVDGVVPGLTDDDEWQGEFMWSPDDEVSSDHRPFIATK